MMNIIGNISGKHIKIIRDLAKQANELFFLSPFCYQDFTAFFEEVIHNQIKKVTLITTLKPEDASYKSNSLVSFIDELNSRNIEWSIKIDNKLHGKLYFFINDGIIKNAIITSANLTDNGMISNHEWGCVISDTKELQVLFNEVLSAVEVNALSEDSVIKLMLAVDEFNRRHPITKNNTEQINLNDIIIKTTDIILKPEIRIFLKPYGSANNKIYDGDFSQKDKMHFSKRRPNSVRMNDLLICYAVGSTKLTSIFKVTSEPQTTGKPTDRWPWYVDVENLTPKYGKKWFTFDHTLSKVADIFLQKDNNNYLTYNGGRTLGAFQRGSDKIRLNDDFGKFLIELIEKSTV